jgi:hypothetical protein
MEYGQDNSVLLVTPYDLLANPLTWFECEARSLPPGNGGRLMELEGMRDDKMKRWVSKRVGRGCKDCQRSFSSTNALQKGELSKTKSGEDHASRLSAFVKGMDGRSSVAILFVPNEGSTRLRVRRG